MLLFCQYSLFLEALALLDLLTLRLTELTELMWDPVYISKLMRVIYCEIRDEV
jgi:hypothetical protein